MLWQPFLLAAAAEVLGLMLIWLAPHPPFSALLAPPIRYVAGEAVLHYPAHLWFLYHAMRRIHLVMAVLVGGYCSALACAMVRQTHDGQALSLRQARTQGGVHYADVTLITLAAWLAMESVSALLARVLPRAALSFTVVLGAALALQTLVACAIPAAVYEQLRWPRALARGAREACRHPLRIFLMVAVPSLVVIGFNLIASEHQVRRWMMLTAPEIALCMVLIRLVVHTLADAVLTVGVAHLWWLHRGSQAC
jgi:hypothetical protein